MIFFILSFFVGYILSFELIWLRTIRFSARAGTHIERRCSHSCTVDVTITDVIIKTPDRNGTGIWMTSCPDVRDWKFWWFWKKSSKLRFGPGWSELRFEAGRGESSWAYGMRRAFVGSDGMVSIVKIVSLSPHVERLNSRSQ